MLTLKDNIRAVLDCNFAGTKDEIIEVSLNAILELIENDRKTENSSEKPNNCEPKICDTCRYYNSNIPCGLTPIACKEADKFAKEFVDGLKKLKPKTDCCETCKHKDDGWDSEACDPCSKANSNYEPKLVDYTPDCPFCKRYGTKDCLCYDCRHYKTYRDEPQIIACPIQEDYSALICETCKHYDAEVESIACERCFEGKYSRYEPKEREGE